MIIPGLIFCILCSIASWLFMMLISSSNRDKIANLAGGYADQIFASYNIGDQIMRRSPFRLWALLSIDPPEVVSELVKPLKIAALIHTAFLSASALLILLMLVTN
jgi:hypothetical protein